MSIPRLYQLSEGAILKLKPERALAYGMDCSTVTFVRLEDRINYNIPWVVARDSKNQIGHYKTSDFSS